MYDPWTGTKGRNAGGRRGAGCRRIKGGKMGQCNSIINEIYFKEKFHIEKEGVKIVEW